MWHKNLEKSRINQIQKQWMGRNNENQGRQTNKQKKNPENQRIKKTENQ